MNIVLPWNIFDSVIRLRRVKAFFLYLFPSVWVFEICVWVSWKLRPRETNKEKRFKLVSILLFKMFYGHAMFMEDRDIYPFRFIALASHGYKNWLQFEQHYSHSVFNFYFFSKKIRRQMSWHVLKLDLNSARWMAKLVSIDTQSYPSLTSQFLHATIGPLQDNWPLPLRHQNLRNLTLQQECYLTNTRAFYCLHTAL